MWSGCWLRCSSVVADVALTSSGKGDAHGNPFAFSRVLAALLSSIGGFRSAFWFGSLGPGFWMHFGNGQKQSSRVPCEKKSEDTTFSVLVSSASPVQVERPLNEVDKSGWDSAAAAEALCAAPWHLQQRWQRVKV